MTATADLEARKAKLEENIAELNARLNEMYDERTELRRRLDAPIIEQYLTSSRPDQNLTRKFLSLNTVQTENLSEEETTLKLKMVEDTGVRAFNTWGGARPSINALVDVYMAAEEVDLDHVASAIDYALELVDVNHNLTVYGGPSDLDKSNCVLVTLEIDTNETGVPKVLFDKGTGLYYFGRYSWGSFTIEGSSFKSAREVAAHIRNVALQSDDNQDDYDF